MIKRLADEKSNQLINKKTNGNSYYNKIMTPK